MADPDTDSQDEAEIFDEENITEDGRDIATPDMARDVYDVTSAVGDEDDVDAETDEDFNPDKASEEELEFMLEADDGAGEPRSFRADNAERVDSGDDQPDDFEPDSLSDEELKVSGYAIEPRTRADPHVDRQLDEGLEETFPASDPVSINPGSD